MEPSKRPGNSHQGRIVSTGSAEGVELDILLSKLTSDNIEDQRSAAGDHRNIRFLHFRMKGEIKNRIHFCILGS